MLLLASVAVSGCASAETSVAEEGLDTATTVPVGDREAAPPGAWDAATGPRYGEPGWRRAPVEYCQARDRMISDWLTNYRRCSQDADCRIINGKGCASEFLCATVVSVAADESTAFHDEAERQIREYRGPCGCSIADCDRTTHAFCDATTKSCKVGGATSGQVEQEGRSSQPPRIDASTAVTIDGGAVAPPSHAEAGWPLSDASISPWPETPLPTPSALVRSQGTCRPLLDVRSQPFVAMQPSETLIPPAVKAQAVAGSWIGYAAAPAGWLPERWLITLTLRSDGRYAAQGHTANEVVPPFYYGSTAQSDLMRWRLTATAADGVTHLGGIDVPFEYSESFDLPGWKGELDEVALDAHGERLRFAFSTSSGHGPVQYELYRVCD